MPLFKTFQITPNTTVLVWKIDESLTFLKDVYLSKNSLNRLNSMKSVQHQKGFLSIRHLLQQIQLTDKDLYYNKHGKPLLTNKQHISITHSFDFSAIVISDVPIGIDIEKNRGKIKIIRHRFTDFIQAEQSDETYIQQLTYIWGAKESMFKIHPCGGMSFKNDLKIRNFTMQTAEGFIDTPEMKQSCQIYFHQIENYSLAIATAYEPS